MSFPTFSGGDTPEPPQRDGATPSRTNLSLACGRTRGASAPAWGPKPRCPSTFQP